MIPQNRIDHDGHAARARRIRHPAELFRLRQPGHIADVEQIIREAERLPRFQRLEQIIGRIRNRRPAQIERVGNQRRRKRQNLVAAVFQLAREHAQGNAAATRQIAKKQNGHKGMASLIKFIKSLIAE